MAIQTQSKISVRASLNYLSQREQALRLAEDGPHPPLESLALLVSHQFQIKLVGLDQGHCVVFKKIYESDPYGDFDLKIPATDRPIDSFQIFEISNLPGIDLLLGTRIPIRMKYPKQVVISDFDKTLVDTRYSTPQEVYESLRKPIDYFPTVAASVDIFTSYIEQQFQPFILSASPHFYENAIRDWLYQNNIYTAEIFLKDYRKIISILDGLLTTKDVKSQGFYKLNHLVSILLMTGIPDKLVLIGDGFESDSLIYLILSSMLQDQREPWDIWKEVKKLKAFRMNRRQDALFLTKVYQLQNEMKRKQLKPELTIHIRRPEHLQERPIPLPFLSDLQNLIHYYSDSREKQ